MRDFCPGRRAANEIQRVYDRADAFEERRDALLDRTTDPVELAREVYGDAEFEQRVFDMLAGDDDKTLNGFDGHFARNDGRAA